jgi:hypothetical protein
VPKVQHKPIKSPRKGSNKKSKRQPRQPWSGAPDCPVCHRTVSGAPGWIISNLLASGIQGGRSAIIHRTVRCSTGLSGVPSGATVASATVEFNGRLTTLQCTDCARRVRAGADGVPDSEQCLSGAPPDYPVAPQVRAPMVEPYRLGDVAGAPDSVRWRTGLSGAPFDSRGSPTTILVVGAINTPQPPLFKASKHSLHLIQYKSNTQHSKTQIKASDRIKVPNSTLGFRTCEEIDLCSFVVLVAWLDLFFL